MPTEERRRTASPTTQQLRAQLNELQLGMARQLERFGWDLRFVRKPPFQPAVPVLFGDGSVLCLREDGTTDETAPIELRKD
ncbi:MAG: hypothetical protein ACREPE_05350 [Lysobacter sp.]